MKTITSKILGFLVILSSVTLLSCSKQVDIPTQTGTTSTYDIFLTNGGTQSANVISQIKSITGLGLKEAKDLVGAASPSTPKIIKSNITMDEANQIRVDLTALGATVDIQSYQP